MLKISIQLPCRLFVVRFESRLRTTGTRFFYTFHSRQPFVCLSLGINPSAHYCFCDFEFYYLKHKDLLYFLMRNHFKASYNYFVNIFTFFYAIIFTLDVSLTKMVICQSKLTLLYFEATFCLQDLNVPYVLPNHMTLNAFFIYDDAY